ncbi:MAG: hypothetical protein JST55_14505 [Bacteroidetes bacterium]|nr:hypothetical protein [Bacteroidota bacterium]
MSQESYLIKQYSLLSGEYEFHFMGSVPKDLNIFDISELSQGFEDPDNDDTSVYPSGIELTIDDFDDESANYNYFVNVLNLYNNRFPFNYEQVFYLLIKRNNENFFKGYLESVDRDVKEKQIVLRFTDGISKLKNTNLGDPRLLDYLHHRGLIPRTTLQIENISNPNDPMIRAHQYGFSINAVNTQIGTTGNYTLKPGSIYAPRENDKDINLLGFITELFKILNPDIQIEFDCRLRFYNNTELLSEPVEMVGIRKILANLIGRYLVFKKGVLRPIIGVTDSGDKFSQSFERVYEDDEYITYYHNWNGDYPLIGSGNPPPVTLVHYNQGLGPLKINELLKTLARNLFSYYSFSSFDKVSWKHKRIFTNYTELKRILSMNVVAAPTKIKFVRVSDAYNKIENSSGNIGTSATLEEPDKLEYQIPFTAISEEYPEQSRLFFFSSHLADYKVSAAKLKDLENDDTNPNPDYIQQRIATSERNKKDEGYLQYEIEVEGIDYDFCETYKITRSAEFGVPGPQVFLQPVMMEKNLQENKTKITGVRIK